MTLGFSKSFLQIDANEDEDEGIVDIVDVSFSSVMFLFNDDFCIKKHLV